MLLQYLSLFFFFFSFLSVCACVRACVRVCVCVCAECDDFILVDNVQRREFVIFCEVLRYIRVIIIVKIIMFPSA